MLNLTQNYILYRCGKGFAAKRYLRSHIMRHESQDNYSRSVVLHNVSYKSEEQRKQQVLMSSNKALNKTKFKLSQCKKHQCTYCEKSYTRRSRLNEHIIRHLPKNAVYNLQKKSLKHSSIFSQDSGK